MSKINILAIILVGLLIFAEGAGFIYFANKSHDLSGKLKDVMPKLEKLSEDNRQMAGRFEGLSKTHDNMQKDYEAMKMDRNNLFAQAKSLLADSGKAKGLEDEIRRMEEERTPLEEEIDRLLEENMLLEESIKGLQETQQRVAREGDDSKSVEEKVEKYNIVEQLRKEISLLEERRSQTEVLVQDYKSDLDILKEQKSKLELEKAGLAGELERSRSEYIKAQKRYEEDFQKAVEKNNALEQKLKDTPQKFTELARQNKRLVAETAGMHYNLGVFYTKNGEYKRAITEFQKAEEIRPEDPYTHFNLGYIYAEYLVNRTKAMEHFRHFLRLAKADDEDAEWVRKYLLTWESYGGKRTMK
ncbi:MAG: tetratricopeptide repeat protein [Candidatus Omnitrophota bacterium]